jgi:hypothetical protein
MRAKGVPETAMSDAHGRASGADVDSDTWRDMDATGESKSHDKMDTYSVGWSV